MNSDVYGPGGQAIAQLMLTLFRVNNLALTWGDRLVGHLGLTSARWQVMGAIALRPQPVAWLARDLGSQRQSIQRIVNDLHALGFVDFEMNPHHRRSPVVVLTEVGRRRIEEAMSTYAPVAEGLAEELGVEGLVSAHQMLDALRVSLEQRLAAEKEG